MSNDPFVKNDMDVLSPPTLLAGITPYCIGSRIYCFKRIDSTNRAAKKLAVKRVPDGTLIIADYQTAGRGRLQRSWIAPPGSSLLCSVILYPRLSTDEIARITMVSSLAIVRAISDLCPIEPMIKWPNDVYIGQKKVCGILTEYEATDNLIRWVVIGIGINVNFDPTCYPAIANSATSLQQACGIPISRTALARRLIFHLDDLYRKLTYNGFPELRQCWKEHSCILHKNVIVTDGDTLLTGIASDVTENGHLILQHDDGYCREILCGDVSLR
ncbi:MAG: biotin--[acetyl-CoA-carboxylase] ligase [Desulfobacterota bacterium]|nr:biotin--[acetyl-CoA-carboxylase] ligase [Thermodesulfobacteriota bacterium]